MVPCVLNECATLPEPIVSVRKARARAIARQRNQPAPWLPWLILLTALLIGVVAHAQGATPPVAGRPPSTTAPTRPPEILDKKRGLIVPRSSPDSGMVKTPPQTAGSMPVIPPPGTPGGTQKIIPK